jgi:hypothetical protein
VSTTRVVIGEDRIGPEQQHAAEGSGSSVLWLRPAPP